MNSVHRIPRVLIVDDDRTTNLILQDMIQSAGFQPASALDVAGAFLEIESECPDLILLDVHLPDGSGFDVCRRLKSSTAGAGVPVLFISANEDIEAKLTGFQVGGVDYITKPLAGPEVIARVTTHLRLKQAYERLAELQADRLTRLASSQKAIMPLPEDHPESRFHLYLRQILPAGGDFYDVIQVRDQVTDYIVADASGQDLGASLWTISLKTLLSEYASPVNSPLEVVHMVNNALHRILPSGEYFTLIYARLDRRSGHLTLVNAAHPPACIVHSPDQRMDVVWQEGDVLGVFSDAYFPVEEKSVQPGDRFYLYSDGLVETNGPRESGLARLALSCITHGHLPLDQAISAIVQGMTLESEVKDDIVLMGVDV